MRAASCSLPTEEQCIVGTDERQAFIDEVLPDAYAAASHLGIPVSPVLAQWCDETGNGTSDAWLNGHNYAGVSQLEPFQESIGAHYGDQGSILFYPDRQAGLAGYIARWSDPVYEPTRAAMSAHAHDAYQVAQDIEQSPWAAGHYGGNGLKAIMIGSDLTRYDGKEPPAPSHGDEQPPCGALRPGAPPEHLRLLKVGMHGDDVKVVQTVLRDRGFKPLNTFRPDGTPDGIFGSETAGAVVAFQNANGLHADGIVGRQTWCAFGER